MTGAENWLLAARFNKVPMVVRHVFFFLPQRKCTLEVLDRILVLASLMRQMLFGLKISTLACFLQMWPYVSEDWGKQPQPIMATCGGEKEYHKHISYMHPD